MIRLAFWAYGSALSAPWVFPAASKAPKTFGFNRLASAMLPRPVVLRVKKARRERFFSMSFHITIWSPLHSGSAEHSRRRLTPPGRWDPRDPVFLVRRPSRVPPPLLDSVESSRAVPRKFYGAPRFHPDEANVPKHGGKLAPA